MFEGRTPGPTPKSPGHTLIERLQAVEDEQPSVEQRLRRLEMFLREIFPDFDQRPLPSAAPREPEAERVPPAFRRGTWDASGGPLAAEAGEPTLSGDTDAAPWREPPPDTAAAAEGPGRSRELADGPPDDPSLDESDAPVLDKPTRRVPGRRP